MRKGNLAIWEQVEATDPEFTKHYKGKGGFEGSALNPSYLTKRATELFGPIGTGWGYEIEEERYDQGAPLNFMKDAAGNEHPVYAVIHTIRMRLWYRDGEEIRHVVHYGHTDFIYQDKFGIRTEAEPGKKSLTDALKKCLSMLGFSADVFMGKFDNQDYVEEMRNKVALEKADDKAEEQHRQMMEYKQWLESHAELIRTALSLHELEAIFKLVIRKLKMRDDKEQILAMTRLKDARKEALTAKREDA